MVSLYKSLKKVGGVQEQYRGFRVWGLRGFAGFRGFRVWGVWGLGVWGILGFGVQGLGIGSSRRRTIQSRSLAISCARARSLKVCHLSPGGLWASGAPGFAKRWGSPELQGLGPGLGFRVKSPKPSQIFRVPIIIWVSRLLLNGMQAGEVEASPQHKLTRDSPTLLFLRDPWRNWRNADKPSPKPKL